MKRRGFSVMEAMVAAALLAMAGVVCLQMLMASASARRNAELRRLATREASNVMEQVMALRADELTAMAADRIELSDEAKRSLPDAKLAIRLDRETGDGPPATRVTVELSWKSRAGEPAPPIRLLAWRFQTKESQP